MPSVVDCCFCFSCYCYAVLLLVLQGDVLPAGQLSGVGVLMLQREVPEAVNMAAAQAAAAAGAIVMLVSHTCKGNCGVRLCRQPSMAAV